jgi:hypothetical protein
MAHLVETMAYAGEVPWHGLGVQVPSDLSPEQMLDKAGLNWTVEKKPAFFEMDDKKFPVGWSALTRSSDNSVLDIVSNDWNPVQNHEAFNFFEEYCRVGDMDMHTAGSLKNGQIVWALAKVKDSFELFKGDQVDSYLLFTNPHRFGQAIDIRFTPIRVVCNNTLQAALNGLENKVSIISGEYDVNSSTYSNSLAVESPTNSMCEKNWLHVPGTDHFIHSWNPLQVGRICDTKFDIFKSINLPPFFSLLRGSAPPIEVNGKWFVLTHLVEYAKCRNYYHCIVELEKESYTPLKVSMPFTFKGSGIEYCVSGRLLNNNILEYYVSFMDKDSSRVSFSIDSLEWVNLN